MCGCGSGSSSYNSQKNTSSSNRTIIEDCNITKENLLAWKALLQCIKNNQYYTQANTSEFTINQFLGIIQSALNYTNNYCYYNEQLEFFKTNILPNYINNVPQCINQ